MVLENGAAVRTCDAAVLIRKRCNAAHTRQQFAGSALHGPDRRFQNEEP